MAVTKNIGMLVLAVWLILQGLMGLGVAIGPLTPALAILALIAGVAILLGR